MNVSQYGLLDCYNRAFAAIVKAYVDSGMTLKDATAQAGQAVLSQSYLRLEQPYTGSGLPVPLPILNNQGGTVRPTEVRLAQQDSFFCSNIAIYLAKASSAQDVTFVPQTYPNSEVFVLGGVPGASVPLMAFWNGFLQIIINKSVIVPNYPLTNFWQVPQTQAVAAGAAPVSQFDPSQVALWEPNINFVGTKASNLVLNFPGAMAAGTIDANMYVIAIIQGVLAQNVTLMS